MIILTAHSSVAKPEQIVPDAPETGFARYTSSAKTNELEIVHTYTLHNKGPSDAKRTEVKLMWPMLPVTGFNDQASLMHSLDLPTVIRVSDPKAKNDRCHPYHSVRFSYPQDDDGLWGSLVLCFDACWRERPRR